MTRRSAMRAGTASLMIACILASAPSAALAQTSQPDITGTIVSPSGKAMAGVKVLARVEPTPEQFDAVPVEGTVVPVDIGWAETDRLGNFALSVTDFKAIAKHTADNQLVSILLSAPTEEGQIIHRIRMVFTPPNKLSAYQPDIEALQAGMETNDPSPNSGLTTLRSGGAALTRSGTARLKITPIPGPGNGNVGADGNSVKAMRASALSASANDPAEQGDPEFDFDPDDSDFSTSDRPDPSKPAFRPKEFRPDSLSTEAAAAAIDEGWDPSIWCGGHYWFYKKNKYVDTRWVILASQATGGKTTGEFTYEQTNDTSFEIGVTYERDLPGKLIATLGLTEGKKEAVKVESRLKKKKAGEYRIGMDFNIFDIMCGSSKDGSTWWSGRSEYRPKEFNGDYNVKKWTNPFKCKAENKSYIGGDTDVEMAVTKTSTKEGAFSIYGKLKASQKWEETQKVKFKKIKSTSDGYHLCGFEGKYTKAVTAVKQV